MIVYVYLQIKEKTNLHEFVWNCVDNAKFVIKKNWIIILYNNFIKNRIKNQW